MPLFTRTGEKNKRAQMFSVLKVLRILRVHRPLRAIYRAIGLNVIVNSYSIFWDFLPFLGFPPKGYTSFAMRPFKIKIDVYQNNNLKGVLSVPIPQPCVVN